MLTSQRPIDRIVQKLGAAQQAFLRAADGVPPANWQRAPSCDRWSAAELVAHLCLVERGVLGYADRVIRKPAVSMPFFRRLHLPIRIVESRVIRRQSPQAMEPPASLSGKESMIAELRGVRERTLAFLQETQQRNLAAYLWRHPFLGNMNFYDWFTFVGAHQTRHTKQMLEIVKNLPKDVATS